MQAIAIFSFQRSVFIRGETKRNYPHATNPPFGPEFMDAGKALEGLTRNTKP